MIKIKGIITSNDEKWIYDWFDIEATSPADVELQMKDDGDRIVEINSPGGYVTSGSEIYAMLYDKGYEVRITGEACSAASVIAMAGQTVKIYPTAQIMIHNASAIARGDYRNMDKASDTLKKVNTTIANAYMLKTGLELPELLALMDEETWFTPQEAKEKGFVDEIIGMESTPTFTNATGMLPTHVIEKMMNKKMKAKIQLMELRGK